MKKPFFNIVILIFVITSFVNGSIPKIISYQGVVTDSKRNPKQDGKYDFIFTIYNDSVSGDSIWSEKKEIETKQGLFSTELGSVESLALPFDKTYWLGISVEGKAFTKRTKLTCAPYSFRADTADVAKKADTAEIAKGLVDSFYTRDQLKTSGKAKVHAGNIENAPWLDSNPFDQNLNTKNNVKFRFINSNNSSGISIDSVTADNDGSSTSNWNVVSQIKLTSYNNTMAFFTGYPQNQRKSFIQVGHRDSRYGGCTGELRLNPFGGSVTINGYSPWHSGNLDTSKFSLKTDFNPDYFVQGENSFRRCNFDSSTQLD
ncbi:MAG: hypothetical protein GXY77_11840, partial [Fibrobacter sp.]|nr:hypothetical protein [Fibrobacter sp.]